MPVPFLVAPVFAAIASVAVHAKVDLPVTHVYVPAVVFGKGVYEISEGHALSFTGSHPVTEADVDRVTAEFTKVGIDRSRMTTWRQSVEDERNHFKPIDVGIIFVDLGAPADAQRVATELESVHDRAVAYGWTSYIGVDCANMSRRIQELLQAKAHAAASAYTGGRIASLALTTDPRNGTFMPVPLCPSTLHPVVKNTGARPPIDLRNPVERYVSADAMIQYQASPISLDAPPGAGSVFPFSTFGFAAPIIGQQERAYVLRGRFAATPGESEVAIRADTAIVDLPFAGAAEAVSALKTVRAAGVAQDDALLVDSTHHLVVRLHPVLTRAWSAIAPMGRGNQRTYVFVNDCKTIQGYSRDVALARSHELASAGAAALHARLGPLLVQTDYAGSQTDANCGTDGSGDLRALLPRLASMRATSGSPLYATFWSSLYAAWQLGPKPARIEGAHIVKRLSPVIVSEHAGTPVTGSATIVPDAYFYQDNRDTAQGWSFKTTVVKSRDAVPKGVAAGNVVTDCDAAQDHALENALKVALFDGPVQSFYAKQASFLSIACYSRALIGRTYDTFPTVYNASSATGAAIVTDAVTVYR